MNGSCHSQQFTTIMPASNTANPTGDSTSVALQKQISQTNQAPNIEAQPNGSHSLIMPNGDHCGEEGLENGGVIAEEEAPCIDIIINNVVCSFSTRCYLNLKKIATEGVHVEYRRENGVSLITKKQKKNDIFGNETSLKTFSYKTIIMDLSEEQLKYYCTFLSFSYPAKIILKSFFMLFINLDFYFC